MGDTQPLPSSALYADRIIAWVPPTDGYDPCWRPPSKVEAALLSAKRNGDWRGYIEVLRGAAVFHRTTRAAADSGQAYDIPTVWDPRLHTYCEPLYTAGELPAAEAEIVYIGKHFENHVAPEAHVDHRHYLAVNPGTPVEVYFPMTTENRRTLARVGAAVVGPHAAGVHTLWNRPQRGEVAFGLGCAALLNANNGSPWNELGHGDFGYDYDRRLLAEWWGITDRATLRDQLATLLDTQAGWTWEFVLSIREALERVEGGPVDPVRWRAKVTAVLGERLSRVGRPEDHTTEVSVLCRLVGRIVRYEQRFRADGLLPIDGHVRSVQAWDLGRAAAVARWGAAARYCSLAEAQRTITRAGELVRPYYDSWEALAAGYIMGRCLHFDGEEFGHWYLEMVETARLLAAAPDGPWQTQPWK
ncbi:DUF1266 domain-containing protein [Nocardia stercoris]|nr:DUF1266 domain-containing protein [Nocardia stercoris]